MLLCFSCVPSLQNSGLISLSHWAQAQANMCKSRPAIFWVVGVGSIQHFTAINETHIGLSKSKMEAILFYGD